MYYDAEQRAATSGEVAVELKLTTRLLELNSLFSILSMEAASRLHAAFLILL